MTNKIYEFWIRSNVPPNPLRMCSEICDKMLQQFPYLRKVRGHYHCPLWGEQPHWWLIDPLEPDQPIDPTRNQFPSRGVGVYVPWDESLPEPNGKCHNCGELVFDGSVCCSEECVADYIEFCTKGL